MATTVAITDYDFDLKHEEVFGTITLAGNYGGGATHGDTLSFAVSDLIKSAAVPLWVDIFEAPVSGTAPNGYIFTYCPGTTRDNGVVTITNNLTEITQGVAYSAGLLAAVIIFRAVFPSFV